MNVTVTGHFYAVPENRAKWEVFAKKYPETMVSLIVPDSWATGRYGRHVEYRVGPERCRNYEVIPLPLWKHGRTLYRSPDMGLRRLRPDIFMILQEPMDWLCLQALVYSRLWAPQAVTIGGTTVNTEYKLTRPHHIWKERFVFEHMDAMTADNSEVARILRAHGFQKPILVQQGIGADERVWQPGDGSAVRARLNLRSFVVGYVGALVEDKGLLDLVGALAQLQADWHLLLVGDGPLRTQLAQQVARLGQSHRIHFAGFVPRGETPSYYQAMDVFVLASRTTATCKEQFGVVIVEAMLCGVPVVGSDSGAIPEVIGDAGLIFPEGDVAALAACLQCLHDNPDLRRELAERGRQRALARYSASAMAEESHRFFQALLRDKQGMSHQDPDAPRSDNRWS